MARIGSKPADKADKSAVAEKGAAKKDGGKKKAKPKKTLAYGVVKFKSFMVNGKWRFITKAEADLKKKLKFPLKTKLTKKGVPVKEIKKNRPAIVEKPIKGPSNGETRKVHLRRKAYYPTAKRPVKHYPRGLYKEHKRSFRSTLTPGAILILLAGANKGKRVVLLKNLPSGLLMVTGPFLLNGVPVRRVHPCRVIGTKTRLDVSNVKLPEKLDDAFFKRTVEKRKVKKGDRTVFVKKKKSYTPSKDRKVLQDEVDTQVLAIIKKHPEKKLLLAYLSSMFGLRNNQYPHRLQF